MGTRHVVQQYGGAVLPILTWLEVYPLPAAAFMRSPLQEQPCKSKPTGEICGMAARHSYPTCQQEIAA